MAQRKQIQYEIDPARFIDKFVRLNELGRGASIQSDKIILDNGTTIQAIASEYAGAAGSNHGLTSWDELWGYVSESSRRLYEELSPVPTRKNSIRLITSYAGWEGESELLLSLYKQAVGKEEHPEGQGERIHQELPVYGNAGRGTADKGVPAVRAQHYVDGPDPFRSTEREKSRGLSVRRIAPTRIERRGHRKRAWFQVGKGKGIAEDRRRCCP